MKYLKKIGIALSILFIIYYIVCFWNTNSLIKDFKYCVQTQQETNTKLDRYIRNYSAEQGSIINSKVKIYRKFVVHNFRKGVMYINYSYELYNINGNIVGDSWNIPSKWYIEKQNGRWVVTDIDERP